MRETDFGTLFPNFVCRMAGLTTVSIAKLRSCQSSAALAQIFNIEQQLATHRQELTAALYDCVSGLDDRRIRHQILAVKRDVHNLRSITFETESLAFGCMAESLQRQLLAFSAMQDRHRYLLAEFEDLYQHERDDARKIFQALVMDERFLKGVALSSPSLYSAVGKYEIASEVLNRKQRKTEISLLRYYTRMALKTTPFSTFCLVLPGQFVGQMEAAQVGKINVEGDVTDTRDVIRINKSLYALLLKHFEKVPAVQSRLRIEANTSIVDDNDKFIFLAHEGEREVVRRIIKTPFVIWLLTILDRYAGMTQGALIEQILNSHEIDAGANEVAAYVQRLVDLGLLILSTCIRDREDDWALPLAEILSKSRQKRARRAADTLVALDQCAKQLTTLPVEERPKLIVGAKEDINNLLEDLEIPTKVALPFYEDATAAAQVQIPYTLVQDALRVVEKLVALTVPISYPAAERANMRHFFDHRYAEDFLVVPLMRFYEDYYRSHFKAHLERMNHAQGGVQGKHSSDYNIWNPFELEEVTRIGEAQISIRQLIHDEWARTPNSSTISISVAGIENALKDFSRHALAHYSVSAFVQVASVASRCSSVLVMNDGGYLAGYGKYFSRFLHFLPQSITEELREVNTMGGSRLGAEICDDAHFNANLHPPLTSHEIRYPTAEGGAPERQISCAELMVGRDRDHPHSLVLSHRASGQLVSPIDLGFLNPRMRPPLYRLLSLLVPATGFSLSMPESLGDSGQHTSLSSRGRQDTNTPSIVSRPRIMLDDVVVVARRRWQVPSECFPLRERREPDSAYFLRVNRWRHEQSLPQEVFVRVFPLAGPSSAGRRSRHRSNTVNSGPNPMSDLHKPQYIDFENPLLVNLFGELSRGLDRFYLLVEERLPAEHDMIKANEQTYSTEFVLQFDLGPSSYAPA